MPTGKQLLASALTPDNQAYVGGFFKHSHSVFIVTRGDLLDRMAYGMVPSWEPDADSNRVHWRHELDKRLTEEVAVVIVSKLRHAEDLSYGMGWTIPEKWRNLHKLYNMYASRLLAVADGVPVTVDCLKRGKNPPWDLQGQLALVVQERQPGQAAPGAR